MVNGQLLASALKVLLPIFDWGNRLFLLLPAGRRASAGVLSVADWLGGFLGRRGFFGGGDAHGGLDTDSAVGAAANGLLIVVYVDEVLLLFYWAFLE
jgi:hypothetical protein